jgi:hypothetical protein
MVTIKEVENQLKKADCPVRLWGRAEMRELSNILMPGETIAQAVNGYYEGGFAMICVTDRRLLLIDRKPMFLTLEDIRFEMISEIDYHYRLLNATVRIMTPNQTLVFTSWNQARLRKLASYAQNQIMELRHGQFTQQFPQQDDGGWAQPTRHVPVRDIASFAMAHAWPASAVAGAPQTKAGMYRSTDAINTSAKMPINPYRRVPSLARRRPYPSFY